MSDLTGQPKFTSIVLTWSAPQEPNGVIISYEVTYRVGDGNLVTTNTTDLTFTIPSLTPGTNVTEISVSAYTSVGRGDHGLIFQLLILTTPRESLTMYIHKRIMMFIFLCITAMVINIMVMATSATSVRVSWDRLDIPEITGYIVYYSQTRNSEMVTIETSVSVPSSQNSVMINNYLLTDVEYQFQMVAFAELEGEMATGLQRSARIMTTLPPITSAPSSIPTSSTLSSNIHYTIQL